MPILDFKCSRCGCIFEELIRSASADLAKVRCPECGAEKPERVYQGKCLNAGHASGCTHNCATCPGCGKRKRACAAAPQCGLGRCFRGVY